MENVGSLSHISVVHILREISDMQSSVFCRAGRRKALPGTNLCSLFSFLVSRSSTHQRLCLRSQLSRHWCKSERLRSRFLCTPPCGLLNRVHELVNTPKHPIFCNGFLSKSLDICIHNPEARFHQIQI